MPAINMVIAKFLVLVVQLFIYLGNFNLEGIRVEKIKHEES